MTTKSNTDSDSRTGTQLTRRTLLTALATGGGAAALTALSDADSRHEATSLGGNARESAAAGRRYGGWSLAPSTIPPTDRPVTWTRDDDPGHTTIQYDDATLPTTWVASGIQWSLASDYQTAKANVSQYPALAGEVTDAGAYFAWIYDDTELPYAYSVADGRFEIVLHETFAAAESTWSGSRPALVYGLAGYGEVKH
jgi:hypothetical protein